MEAFVGTILPWPISWAPNGWLLCQGQQVQIQQYMALFSLLSVTYGGDGRTVFNLPDLRSRLPMGAGAGTGLTPRVLGEMAGSETVTLSQLNVPPHVHPANFTASGGASGGSLQASSQQGNSTDPQGNYLSNAYYAGDPNIGVAPATLASYVTPAAAGTLAPLAGLSVSGSGGGTVTVLPNTGGNVPVPTMPPVLVLNYIICAEGLYPPRP